MLKNSIFRTLAFFDAQDLPLTLLEVQNYLSGADQKISVSLTDIQQCIAGELHGRVEHSRGLYFLKGRENLVRLRTKRYPEALQRFRKAKQYLWGLRFMPYVRGVAISGSQALLNNTETSDIDLFIITRKNRIWITRALVSLYFQILGQRRHGSKIQSRFCLNPYIASDTEITDDRNLYTAVEYARLLPVLGEREFQKFWKENQWTLEYLQTRALEQSNEFFHFRFSRLQKILETVLDFTVARLLNYSLGLYQKNRITVRSHILISDCELSFHP